MLYIKNAEIYTPHKVIKKGNILIGGSRISKILDRPLPKLPPGTKILDVKGKIACPGFIDVHLQGAGGYDFLDATPLAVWEISRTLARFGTTSYLATTVFKNGKNPHIDVIVRSQELGVGSQGAQLLGIHLEGPFVNPKKKGMIRLNGIKDCSLTSLNKILKITKGKLRMMTIAPELNGAMEIIKRLKKKKIIASFGHSDATVEETKKGIEAGVTHATHIFNAMRQFHHREPGPLGAIFLDDRVSVQLISDGVHIHPEVIKLIVRLKGVENIVLITDSMSSLGLPDGKYVYDGWEYESRNGACRYKDGTLIGTSLPLNRMVQQMVKFGGVNLTKALQMATINPAKVLGVDTRKGSIEEGKDADLVIMDKECNIFMTLISGNIVYSKSPLGR